MPIDAVNGSRTLFENHHTKFCTWKLYDILVAPCQARCHKPYTPKHEGSSKFLFNCVQVFISCVWAQYHQIPTDTLSDETQNNNVALPPFSENVHHSPSKTGRTSACIDARRIEPHHCETNDIPKTNNTYHNVNQPKYAPTLVLVTTQP